MSLEELYGSMDDKSRESKEEEGITYGIDKSVESNSTGVFDIWIRGDSDSSVSN